MENVWTLFDQETKQWFLSAVGEPTPVQKEAWPYISSKSHVLVSAPTGTGKTLSAFLIFLDRMKRQAREGTLEPKLYLIYISPLKSLAADIRENLKRPLEGLCAQGEITAAIRTGDTSAKERQKMLRKPPHILITTPESLYLMLTGRNGQKMLSSAEAVILDELHALIDTKRGAHLMLSLARLDALCGRPLQRIGLSATIEPLDAAAAYLAPEEVKTAAPFMKKKMRLAVLGPYLDNGKGCRKDSVWQEIGALVFAHCQGKRSVLAFVEGRRYAEKLAYFVNLLGGEGFAGVHHGSLSKEQRAETEQALREGRLRLLCATSSMELGIDVGEIDQVLQVGCPRTVSGTMQRLGRAGHNPGRVSVMYLFARTAAECVLCGMTARLAGQGGIEQAAPPSGCLDVLAQHLVSMAAYRSYTLDEVMKILPRAWPFRNVTKEEVRQVLGMLAGDYEHEQDIPVRPRVLYDRIHEKVEGDGYSRLLAVSAAGTIPDKGLYAVKTREGVKLGEMDEEFVYESQKGDRFLLGSFAWKIVDISRDTVTVVQAPADGARLPFWKGEQKGRDRRTAEAFGRIYASLQEACAQGQLEQELFKLGLDEAAAGLAGGYLKRQIKAAGGLADDKTLIVEHFRDASGNSQLMVHSIFGKRINAPFALLAKEAAQGQMQAEIGSVEEEDGFLLYAYGGQPLPERLLYRIEPQTCRRRLEILLPEQPLFHIAFRYNSSRALMMGAKNSGRQPLWMQRLRSAQLLERVIQENGHPLMRETKRECMQDLWDVDGLIELLEDIRSGRITVREIYSEIPSPMSLPLQWAQEAAAMYDYAPSTRRIHAAVNEALQLEQEEMLRPGRRELLEIQQDLETKLPKDEKQLHSLLMTQGDLAAGELAIPAQLLDILARDGRAVYLEQGLWIAAEQEEEYRTAFAKEEKEEGIVRKARMHIIRRMLRYRGAADAACTAQRYGLDAAQAQEILQRLCAAKEAVKQDGMYYHAQLYRRAGMQTMKNRREKARTHPPQSYAALMLADMRIHAPAQECLKNTLHRYAGSLFPPAFWEGILLAGRIRNYRESMLDTFLAEGELFWHMEDGGIRFDYQEEIDWDADISGRADGLTQKERAVYEALLKRGASFMQPLARLAGGESPYDALMSLMEKGLVYADSFVPVRQYLAREKMKKPAAGQLANMRVKALHAGRWDVVRPLMRDASDDEKSRKAVQESIERCFDRCMVLSRETAAMCGISWQEALSVLRILEYTGQARRGYFVEGMSGAQFIRDKDYASVIRALAEPDGQIVWVNAADPAQLWGKALPHTEGRSFLNVSGTAAACLDGLPAAVFERQGRTLRVFDAQVLEECLKLFVEQYRSGQIFSQHRRIVVREYPDTAKEALAAAGFIKEMNDFALYK